GETSTRRYSIERRQNGRDEIGSARYISAICCIPRRLQLSLHAHCHATTDAHPAATAAPDRRLSGTWQSVPVARRRCYPTTDHHQRAIPHRACAGWAARCL